MPQAADHRLRLVEQIGDQHDHAALDQRLGELVQRPADVRLARRAAAARARAAARAGGRAARSPAAATTIRSSNAISPAASRCRFIRYASDAASTTPYSSLVIGARAAIAHRPADVEQQVAVEVGLLLELLDVVAVAARVDLPVERRQIVAGQVLAVLGELDAEALERAAVQARQEALDDRPRLQLERAEPRDDRGIEKPQVARRGRRPSATCRCAGRGTASSSRSTIVSARDALGLGVEVRDDAVAQDRLAPAPGCRSTDT